MAVEILRQPQGRPAWVRDLGQVLEQVDVIQSRYIEAYPDLDDDLLAYNEMATATILVGAAIQAGMHALGEYVTTKQSCYDRRCVADPRSRGDLWIGNGDRTHGIELKQDFYQQTVWRMGCRLDEAQSDARCLPRNDVTNRLGGLIVSTFHMSVDEFATACVALQDFTQDDAVQAAWRLTYDDSPGGYHRQTYFFFSSVD